MQQWLAFLLWFCINRHSATNKWNWCHVRSGRAALWGRKRERRKRLGYLHSAEEQMERLSSICMRQTAASLSPWPLLWGCDLWAQWKRMGPVWAVVIRLYPVAGKNVWALWLWVVIEPAEECRSSSVTPAGVHAIYGSEWWMEEEETQENVTKTLLFLRQMP